MFTNGKLYVQWPRLVPLEFAPDIRGSKRDRFVAMEKGETRSHKRELSIPSAKSAKGFFGLLFGRWALGVGGSEELELVGVGKDGRAHAE